ERAEAADEGDEERVEGPVRAERVRRVVADVVVREEPPGEARQRRRQRERQELQAERVHPRRLGRLLVLTDRLHAEPGARASERPDHAEGRDRQRERQVVAVGEPIARDRRRGERRDLGEQVADGDAEDLPEREGADGEVRAPPTEGADPEQEGPGPGHLAKSPGGRATRTTKKRTRPTISR